MSDVIRIENLKDLIVEVRGQGVLLDSDVAQVYGVETRDRAYPVVSQAYYRQYAARTGQQSHSGLYDRNSPWHGAFRQVIN